MAKVKISSEKIPTDMYPAFLITCIKNPNKFYAIPLIGFFIKALMLIPVGIMATILGFGLFFTMIINSFIVLATGKFWRVAYEYKLGVMRYSAKIYLFFFGLTDTYPGFDLTIHDTYTLDIPMPANPSRFFAIPFIGGLTRLILLIPYLIFEQVIGTAGCAGVVISFFNVLTKGEYPESTYELARDSVRIREAAGAYMMGLSDSYPSFWISMHHKNVKIALIIAGILLSVNNWGGKNFKARDYNDYNDTPNFRNRIEKQNNRFPLDSTRQETQTL